MLTPYDFFLAGSILRANDEDVAEGENRVMIFVTGYLLPGERHNYLLSTSFLVGPAKTVEQYAMDTVNGRQCAVSRVEHVSLKLGALYKVNAEVLSQLDLFEGHPYCCRREIVAVARGDGGTGPVVQAWMYFK